MNHRWKLPMLGLALVAMLSVVPAFSDEPTPAPPSSPAAPADGAGGGRHEHRQRLQLTDDQKARMKAIHDQFRKKHEADRVAFENQFKSVLTRDQLARVEAHKKEAQARKEAFERGEKAARAQLQKSGQPVPPAAGQHKDGKADGDHHGGHVAMRGGGDGKHEGGPGRWGRDGKGEGGPGGWGHHRGGHGWGGRGEQGGKMLADLKLTPEQMGQLKVYREAMRMKRRAEMKDMMAAMKGVLTPEQQQQMEHHRGGGERHKSSSDLDGPTTDAPPAPPTDTAPSTL